MLEERIRIINLLEVYRPLLTEHQREMMALYYLQDFSLGEIAEETGTSRQAVHDVLKRVTKTLEHYEESLHMWERNQYVRKMTASAIDNIRSRETNRVEYGITLLQKLQSELEKE